MSRILTAVVDRLDRFQQRHRLVALPFAVFKRFGEHDGGRLAATVSYYSFFSIFPLLLVFVTILGIVLRDNEQLREDLVTGALGQIPVIGTAARRHRPACPAAAWSSSLGILAALWAGLGAVDALQHGLDTIGDVPVHERGSFVVKKLRDVAFLVLLAIGLALSTLAGNLATLFDLGWARRVRRSRHHGRSSTPCCC